VRFSKTSHRSAQKSQKISISEKIAAAAGEESAAPSFSYSCQLLALAAGDSIS